MFKYRTSIAGSYCLCVSAELKMAVNRRLPSIKPTAPRPSLSIYSNDALIDCLLRQVSEIKRMQELSTISTLLEENQKL
jgi:hypothetical protein